MYFKRIRQTRYCVTATVTGREYRYYHNADDNRQQAVYPVVTYTDKEGPEHTVICAEGFPANTRFNAGSHLVLYVRPDNPLRFLIYFRLDAVTVPAIYCLAGFTGLVIGLLLL